MTSRRQDSSAASDAAEDQDTTLPQGEVSEPASASLGLPSPWAPGTRIGSYQIESRLASGGMAEVWRATLEGLQGFEKRIVIKTMLPHLHQRPELVEMFVSEASLAARLSHPNIVDVLDFGQMEGRYFIAMEYVPGLTLRIAHRQMVAAGARLPIAMVLHVLSDVCEALQHIHDLSDGGGELGLIHRDISPENLIVSTGGIAKLIDFGAARATARSQPGQLFVGKYRYAAPERIANRGEDRRSDLYSVGVILYECLVGRRPFEGSDEDVIRAATSAACCDPAPRNAAIPASVAEVVRKATAQQPADRFDSARELGAALAACLFEIGASSRERDVTSALSALLGTDANTPPPVSMSAGADAVPEAIGGAEASSASIALSEREILEASGPLPRAASADGDQTRRVSLPVPPEAFAPPVREAVEPAGLLFDRGIQLRAAGRFEDALRAWEDALALAPENRLYKDHVRRLRVQVSALGRTADRARPA